MLTETFYWISLGRLDRSLLVSMGIHFVTLKLSYPKWKLVLLSTSESTIEGYVKLNVGFLTSTCKYVSESAKGQIIHTAHNMHSEATYIKATSAFFSVWPHNNYAHAVKPRTSKLRIQMHCFQCGPPTISYYASVRMRKRGIRLRSDVFVCVCVCLSV